jgi:3-methylcrotonyl-CoA carboxylase alpha subunit
MTFASVLVANRGEIACRIIRTARRLDMKTIAVFSEADRDALHVRCAHEAVCIGAAPARESYLSIEKIVQAARESGAECVHPGYGFLSENAAFAQACADAGVVFVGPSAHAILAMGDKGSAKTLMQRIGVPILPGYHGACQESDFLAAQAEAIGYPVAIKALAGGGGKGLRRVAAAADFPGALASAQREAQAAFGESRVLIEKWVERPRHVEVQIFGDAQGRLLHMFERDCSLQRRHQKIIEEAPAPGMDARTRDAMGAAAVKAAKAVGYVGAGTVEFVVDAGAGLRPDAFWFMEMNTRLQVEHAVTEAITGLDLVELQFRVAAGEPLAFAQEDLAIGGHAIEARIYAEDPAHDFLPSAGRLAALRWPQGEGVRVEAGVEGGAEVSPFYDPLLAKVIAHGVTREEAAVRLSTALSKACILGPSCNLALLADLVRSADFHSGRVDTGSVERFLGSRPADRNLDAIAVATAVWDFIEEERSRWQVSSDPWAATDSFQLGQPRRSAFEFEANGRRLQAFWSIVDAEPELEIPELGLRRAMPISEAAVDVASEPGRRLVWRNLRQTEVRHPLALRGRQNASGESVVLSPMPGRIVKLLVEAGARVEKGQAVVVVEAMKMEHVLRAPRSGAIASLSAREGDRVALGQLVFQIRGEEETADDPDLDRAGAGRGFQPR